MNKPVDPAIEGAKARMVAVLETQKRAQERKGAPSAALRKDRLTRCITMLLTHKDDLVSAMNADFGARSPDMSTLADIVGALGPLKYARANLDKWMKPERRSVTPSALALFGARSELRFQ